MTSNHEGIQVTKPALRTNLRGTKLNEIREVIIIFLFKLNKKKILDTSILFAFIALNREPVDIKIEGMYGKESPCYFE